MHVWSACRGTAGEMPGGVGRWKGRGRATWADVRPPGLVGRSVKPHSNAPIPHIPPKFPNRLRPFCKAPEAEFVLGCRLPSPRPSLLPLQSVAILGSGCRVCSRLWLVAQLAGAPHRLCARSLNLSGTLPDQVAGIRRSIVRASVGWSPRVMSHCVCDADGGVDGSPSRHLFAYFRTCWDNQGMRSSVSSLS